MANPFYSIQIRYSPRGNHWVVLLKGPAFGRAVVLLTQPRLSDDAGGYRSISLLRKKLSYFGLI